jgi:hypothetical protein
MIRGSSPGRNWEFFSSPSCLDRLWGPPSLLSKGYKGALSLGLKRSGREADHSPPSIAEVKMREAISPLPQYAFMAWCSVKESTGTTLTLPYCLRMFYSLVYNLLTNSVYMIVFRCIHITIFSPICQLIIHLCPVFTARCMHRMNVFFIPGLECAANLAYIF